MSYIVFVDALSSLLPWFICLIAFIQMRMSHLVFCCRILLLFGKILHLNELMKVKIQR